MKQHTQQYATLVGQNSFRLVLTDLSTAVKQLVMDLFSLLINLQTSTGLNPKQFSNKTFLKRKDTIETLIYNKAKVLNRSKLRDFVI